MEESVYYFLAGVLAGAVWAAWALSHWWLRQQRGPRRR